MELWIVCLFFQPTLPEMYLEMSQILCFFVVLLMVRRGVGQRPMCRGCLVDLVETETAVVPTELIVLWVPGCWMLVSCT